MAWKKVDEKKIKWIGQVKDEIDRMMAGMELIVYENLNDLGTGGIGIVVTLGDGNFYVYDIEKIMKYIPEDDEGMGGYYDFYFLIEKYKVSEEEAKNAVWKFFFRFFPH